MRATRQNIIDAINELRRNVTAKKGWAKNDELEVRYQGQEDILQILIDHVARVQHGVPMNEAIHNLDIDTRWYEDHSINPIS